MVYLREELPSGEYDAIVTIRKKSMLDDGEGVREAKVAANRMERLR